MVSFGIDFLHIGAVVVIVVVATYLVIIQLRKTRGTKTAPVEKHEGEP